MHTQVAIIGGGPAGLLLALRLRKADVDCIVLERRSRDYVLSRIRAGVLEWGTAEMLREGGVGARMDREGLVHNGCKLSNGDDVLQIDFIEGCGRPVMVYGQTEITHDLYDELDRLGVTIVHEAEGVSIHDAASDAPHVTYELGGIEQRLDCRFVAGCDGFHGVSRTSIPADLRSEYERVYPFGWLGLLSHTPPVDEEIVYCRHERGFALASMRNPTLTRAYIQVPLDHRVEDWSDEAFWDEYRRRLPPEMADTLVTGPSIEKSIAPLRSFVSEPMRYGSLFLAGDAAHIVPPTGAKGLNLAASDVYYLSNAFIRAIRDNDHSGIETYSATALGRVWLATRFSWWMTRLLHVFPGEEPLDARLQSAEFDVLTRSASARATLADQYAGLAL